MDQEIRACLDQRRYDEAFDLLVEQYKNKVFRLAYAIMGNEALAEDISQDVFIRVWKALAGYRGEAALSTWIYTITRNTCLTALNSAASRKAFSLEEPRIRLAVANLHAALPSPESRLDLSMLFSELPSQYRTVMVLFYLEDRSQEEVANMLGLPLGTVKTYLHRARGMVAKALSISKGGI
jgi:RNA polymerase sigma-70 factor (ECF subfamily)